MEDKIVAVGKKIKCSCGKEISGEFEDLLTISVDEIAANYIAQCPSCGQRYIYTIVHKFDHIENIEYLSVYE